MLDSLIDYVCATLEAAKLVAPTATHYCTSSMSECDLNRLFPSLDMRQASPRGDFNFGIITHWSNRWFTSKAFEHRPPSHERGTALDATRDFHFSRGKFYIRWSELREFPRIDQWRLAINKDRKTLLNLSSIISFFVFTFNRKLVNVGLDISFENW